MPMQRLKFLGYYYPRTYVGKQDDFSKSVLSFKYGNLSATLFFYSRLREHFANIAEKTIFLCVPPSSPAKFNNMARLIDWLTHNNRNAKNCSWLIERRYQVPSLCQGGPRDLDTLQKSLICHNTAVLDGVHVVVLDDICTTGTSLHSVYNLIKEANYKSLQFITLARTKAIFREDNF